ncbi:hypothetical protein DIPPA_28360 [Diplonema papillatum]|nr:hypothetical protein DIPPA_28360 [Diplonema papillatum]
MAGRLFTHGVIKQHPHPACGAAPAHEPNGGVVAPPTQPLASPSVAQHLPHPDTGRNGGHFVSAGGAGGAVAGGGVGGAGGDGIVGHAGIGRRRPATVDAWPWWPTPPTPPMPTWPWWPVPTARLICKTFVKKTHS